MVYKGVSNANQSRWLLSLAAMRDGMRDGMRRDDAMRIGGMDRQPLRDWIHRLNAEGPDGLIVRKQIVRKLFRPKRRLSDEQLDELENIVNAGPDFEKDGVVRHVGQILHDLGFSHVSTRPQHPEQDKKWLYSA